MSVTDASFPIINWSKAMPSLRQLMYFACVAEYGSIGQAAEVLHVSQPSLSRQIQALEAHIGEALFVRGPAGVSLTEVGRVVHCRAVKIIAEAKALTRDIGDGDDRQLHIGFSRYLDPGWSGELARQLKEARVCSAVSPSWAPSLDLLSLVRESSLDAAIIGAPPKVVREYELMEIGSYEHVIALSETLHRRLAPDWSLNDLIGEPLLVPKDSLFPAYSQFMNDAMDAAAFAPRRSVRPNDLSILLAQVASGDGFAFLPLSLTKFAYPGWPSPLCRRRSTKASACRWGWRCRRLRGFVPATPSSNASSRPRGGSPPVEGRGRERRPREGLQRVFMYSTRARRCCSLNCALP